MGPLGADTQPPPPSADSAWFLTYNSGFGLHGRTDDGRTDDGRTKPGSPQTTLLRTENRQNFIAKFFFGDFNYAAQFSERSLTPLIGHARVALSGVLARLPSTQTDDTQRGGKGHKLLPTP